MSRLDWSRLHAKILRSSIWLEDPIVRLVWICALADSETDGTFYGSYEVLARAWNLPEPDVERAMKRLCSPDPKSSTQDNEGRRIIEEGGNAWRVLNKRLYNPSGEPQGASTPRVQKFRDKQRDETIVTGNDSNGGNALEENREEQTRSEKEEVYTRQFEESFWGVFPRKVGRADALRAWKKLSEGDRLLADEGVRRFSETWKSRLPSDIRFCPHGATWLNSRRWEDAPETPKLPVDDEGGAVARKVAARKADADKYAELQRTASREIAEAEAARAARGLK